MFTTPELIDIDDTTIFNADTGIAHTTTHINDSGPTAPRPDWSDHGVHVLTYSVADGTELTPDTEKILADNATVDFDAPVLRDFIDNLKAERPNATDADIEDQAAYESIVDAAVRSTVLLHTDMQARRFSTPARGGGSARILAFHDKDNPSTVTTAATDDMRFWIAGSGWHVTGLHGHTATMLAQNRIQAVARYIREYPAHGTRSLTIDAESLRAELREAPGDHGLGRDCADAIARFSDERINRALEANVDLDRFFDLLDNTRRDAIAALSDQLRTYGD